MVRRHNQRLQSPAASCILEQKRRIIKSGGKRNGVFKEMKSE